MSVAESEQTAEQVASPAELSGISPELAEAAGDKYMHLLEPEPEDADVSRETQQDEVAEDTDNQPKSEEQEGQEEEQQDEEQLEQIGDKFQLKVKGQTIEVGIEELKALAQKGMRFTQKTQELSESSKLGLQLKQANGGDKQAQAAIIKQWAANGDLDDLIDSLDGVEAKIDTSKLEEDEMFQIGLDRAFDGVDRNSSEFSNNIRVIESEAKGFLPDDVYNAIVNNPDNLKTFYDMVEDGSFIKAKNIMSVRLATMNPSELSALMSNAAAFGEMYDKIWESVKFEGSSTQKTTNGNSEKTTQRQTSASASSSDEPPSTLSGTRREAQAQSEGQTDYMKDDDAFNKLYSRIKRQGF